MGEYYITRRRHQGIGIYVTRMRPHNALLHF